VGHLISPMMNVGGPCSPSSLELKPIVVIGPEHAELFASAGWTKDDFRKAIWEQARIPMSAWPSDCPKMEELKDNLGLLTPESMIPITYKPSNLSWQSPG